MKDFKIDLFFVVKLTCNKIIGYNYFDLGYLKNDFGYSKQIFWSCGGGYWAYYLGISQAIKEMYPENILSNISWSFSSAGSFGTNVINGYSSPRDTFNECMPILDDMCKLPMCGVYNTNSVMKKIYSKKGRDFIIKKDKRFFPLVLHINWVAISSIVFLYYNNIINFFIFCVLYNICCYHLSFTYNFDSKADYINACIASHNLLFTGNGFDSIIKHPKKWYIISMDGGLTFDILGYIYGYQHFSPYGEKLKCSIITPITFRQACFTNYVTLTSSAHMKKIFDIGYKDAYKNKATLDDIILHTG
jgi:hypothetical protein